MWLLFPSVWYDSESIVQLYLLCIAFWILLLSFVHIRREASLDECRKHDCLAHFHCIETGLISIHEQYQSEDAYFYQFNNQKDLSMFTWEEVNVTISRSFGKSNQIITGAGSAYTRIPCNSFFQLSRKPSIILQNMGWSKMISHLLSCQ